MRLLMRITVRVFQFSLGLFGLLFVSALLTMRSADSRLFPVLQGQPVVEIAVVNHGVHAGIVLKRADIARVAQETGDTVLLTLSERFGAYAFLEVGWGDEQFYRFAPTLSAVTFKMAFSALAGFDESTVLHIVGLEKDAQTTFKHSDVQMIQVSEEGFKKLAIRFADSFAVNALNEPLELGPGIYGPSLFFQATGHYHLFRTCNRWLSDLLSEAGLATSPVPAILSVGLLEELRYRNQL